MITDKKKAMAKKMTVVKLGKEKLKNFSYTISDHKGKILKKGK